MSRYIDAEPFEKELKADICVFKEDGNSASALRFSCFLDRVISQPTADVAPVRHAHRENAISMCGQTYKRCSLCGSRLSAVKTRYCAHCGARMDEEVKENETDV